MQRFLTECCDRSQVVADEDDSTAFVHDTLHFTQALLLEAGVTHSQHLVDEKNLSLQMRHNSEGQTHIHAAGIVLDRRIHKLFGLGKGDNLIKLLTDFLPSHAENSAIHIDVVTAAQFRVKSAADL